MLQIVLPSTAVGMPHTTKICCPTSYTTTSHHQLHNYHKNLVSSSVVVLPICSLLSSPWLPKESCAACTSPSVLPVMECITLVDVFYSVKSEASSTCESMKNCYDKTVLELVGMDCVLNLQIQTA